MDTRAVIVLSTWLAVTVIAAVYMLAFSNKIGDVMFCVFLPVGLLVIVALVVTFTVLPSQQPK
jgi:hypothetical protein